MTMPDLPDDESRALALGFTLLGALVQPGATAPTVNVEARLGALEVLREVCCRWPTRRRMIAKVACRYLAERCGWTDAAPPTRAADLIPGDVQSALELVVEIDPEHRDVVELTRTDLRAARLWGAQLDGAHLMRAHLELADLGEARLRGANLAGANLEGALLYRTDLRGAALWNAGLQRANLTEADLRDADLSRADLRGCVLVRANLAGVALGDALIAGARLDDVRGISPSDLAWLQDTAAVSATPAAARPRRED